MEESRTLQQVQRGMLLRSIYVLAAPVLLTLAALACGTAITELPYLICPAEAPPAEAGPGMPAPLPPPARIIRPPASFPPGAAVRVGGPGTAVDLTFRLLEVASAPTADPERTLYVWAVEISNLGARIYETVPPALMVITRITTAYGEVAGIWRASETAMRAAGIAAADYAPLGPGQARVYRLAAYGPTGTAAALAYLLDGGDNRITWATAPDPNC